MKKIFLIILIFFLSSCGNKEALKKDPSEIMLSIKNYSCKMDISYFSNKNTNKYTAYQKYLSSGEYHMEFLDDDNLKLRFIDSTLEILNNTSSTPIKISNYPNINQNLLFLSYFINTYFNQESLDNIKSDANSITLILPTHNEYIFSAKLIFNNNLPYSLCYYDKNGNEKVNIIYSEFTLI